MLHRVSQIFAPACLQTGRFLGKLLEPIFFHRKNPIGAFALKVLNWIFTFLKILMNETVNIYNARSMKKKERKKRKKITMHRGYLRRAENASEG